MKVIRQLINGVKPKLAEKAMKTLNFVALYCHLVYREYETARVLESEYNKIK